MSLWEQSNYPTYNAESANWTNLWRVFYLHLYARELTTQTHRGEGPEPHRIAEEGKNYLVKNFPNLDYILSCQIKDEENEHSTKDKLPAPIPEAALPNIYVTFKLEPKLGEVVLELSPKLSTTGLKRFVQLAESKFLDQARFFRVVPGFVVQFGMPADPKRASEFAAFKDEKVATSNVRGTISFATSGSNTRSYQMFINLGNNARLDGMGFSPFGKVVSGMEFVDAINSEYGESPDQGAITRSGNEYLNKNFPRLSYIETARVTGGALTAAADKDITVNDDHHQPNIFIVGRTGRDSFETGFAISMVAFAVILFFVAIRVLIGKSTPTNPSARAKY